MLKKQFKDELNSTNIDSTKEIKLLKFPKLA